MYVFQVSLDDPIKPSLQSQFHTESLGRTIQECNDIETLREIAMQLLELNSKKSAMANWAVKRAAEAEKREINLKMSLEE